ncbi:MAG: RidA family protein [Propionibacteriaceae bacterium]|jgi:2-iminobutanoate/2-iminopropanoate deaminase|nr:RidA family protein [Propionibacteriaceae bacterium]
MNIAISTSSAPAAIGPYSQAVDTGRLIFVSGQLGLDPATGDFAGAGVAEQAKQALSNLEAILVEAGLGLTDVVKATVFLKDMADFAVVNQVYAERFTGPILPARSAVQVAALPKGGLVEIEAIAVRG